MAHSQYSQVDRSNYKIVVRFEEDKIDLQTKKATIYTDNPDERLNFVVKGSLVMGRKINTQIPDEDQAIECT